MKERLTSKKFIQWLNDEFKRVGINEYEVYDVQRTRFTSEQYQGGACRLYVRFRSKSDMQNCGTFLCFYSLSEYTDHINCGYKMVLAFEDKHKSYSIQSMKDLVVDLVKL